MEHPYPNLVWNNEALQRQVLETELETAKLKLEREKGNCPLCAANAAELSRLRAIEARLTEEGIKHHLWRENLIGSDHQGMLIANAVLAYVRGEG